MENQNISEEVRWFDLGIILSLTTYRMYAEMKDIQNALKYIVNDSIYTHQIPRVADLVGPYVLSLYPELEGIGVHDSVRGKEAVLEFVSSQKEIFGDSLPVAKMPKDFGYTHIDPVNELIEMKSENNTKVIVIK